MPQLQMWLALTLTFTWFAFLLAFRDMPLKHLIPLSIIALTLFYTIAIILLYTFATLLFLLSAV